MDGAKPLAGLRILVAEDEPVMAKLVATVLEAAGVAEVAVVADGHAVLERLDSDAAPPDALLCDLNMPGMDGVELMRHLAARAFAGRLVLMSAEHMDVLTATRNLAEAHGLAAPEVVRKPLVPEHLVAMLAAAPATAAAAVSWATAEPTADELRRDLAQDRIDVEFQPKVAITDGAPVGVEALVRWRHPRRGRLEPDSFVSMAERSGLIGTLTEAVLTEAIVQGGRWQAAGLGLGVAANLSVDCLSDLTYPDLIARLADDAGFDLARLTLEITESRLMQDIARPLEVLTRLRMKGIALSIDDFGTGYSSMEQLRRLPFSELKIDKAFVQGAATDSKAEAILVASVDLGHRLDMRVVAEGVETEDDWWRVAALGCHVAQGYYVARPIAGAAVPSWSAQWRAVHTVAAPPS